MLIGLELAGVSTVSRVSSRINRVSKVSRINRASRVSTQPTCGGASCPRSRRRSRSSRWPDGQARAREKAETCVTMDGREGCGGGGGARSNLAVRLLIPLDSTRFHSILRQGVGLRDGRVLWGLSNTQDRACSKEEGGRGRKGNLAIVHELCAV